MKQDSASDDRACPALAGSVADLFRLVKTFKKIKTLNFIKKNISPILFSYLTVLVLLHLLPINGKESVLNNNFILSIRLDYIGHTVMFGILTIQGLIYVKKKRKNFDFYTLTFSFFTLLLLAAGMEGLQYIISWRAFNINDLVANGVGVLLSFFVFILIISFLTPNLDKPEPNRKI